MDHGETNEEHKFASLEFYRIAFFPQLLAETKQAMSSNLMENY